MRNILLTIEYSGKNYSGWQRQLNAPSVQQELEEGLNVVLREKVTVIGSGRTDAKVHAAGQCANFRYSGNMPAGKIAYSVNAVLPSDIRIVKAQETDIEFHAQYSAKKKTYIYKFYVSRTSSPLRQDFYAQIKCEKEKLMFDKMQKAVENLIGEHDFAGFSSTGSGITNTVRTVYNAEIANIGDEIIFSVTGNGFLYNMVRIIAGTLAYIGMGKLPENAVSEVLSTQNRKLAGKTFPAHALTLFSVEY